MHYVMAALPADRQGIAGSLFALMRTGGIIAGAIGTTAAYEARLAVRGTGAGEAAPAAFAETFALAAAVALAAALLSLVPARRPEGRRRGALTGSEVERDTPAMLAATLRE